MSNNIINSIVIVLKIRKDVSEILSSITAIVKKASIKDWPDISNYSLSEISSSS